MSTPAPAADVQGLHDNRTHQLVFATVFALFLSTVFLALRLLARHVLRVYLYFDDWLIIMAWVSADSTNTAQSTDLRIAILQDRSRYQQFSAHQARHRPPHLNPQYPLPRQVHAAPVYSGHPIPPLHHRDQVIHPLPIPPSLPQTPRLSPHDVRLDRHDDHVVLLRLAHWSLHLYTHPQGVDPLVGRQMYRSSAVLLWHANS